MKVVLLVFLLIVPNPFNVDIMANKRSRGVEQVNLEVVERVKKKGKRILQETEKPESSVRKVVYLTSMVYHVLVNRLHRFPLDVFYARGPKIMMF